MSSFICGPASGAGRGRRFASALDEVTSGKDRVLPDHAGAGMAHDGTDLFPHVGPVAVDGAVGAGGLLRPEGAFFETLCCVGEKPLTVVAEFPFCSMAFPAEDPDHGLQGFALPLDSGVGFCHGDNIHDQSLSRLSYNASCLFSCHTWIKPVRTALRVL